MDLSGLDGGLVTQLSVRGAGSRLLRRRFWLLRASVGSTEAAKDVVARFGRIDRSSWEVTSQLNAILYACHHRVAKDQRSHMLRCRRTDARKIRRDGWCQGNRKQI